MGRGGQGNEAERRAVLASVVKQLPSIHTIDRAMREGPDWANRGMGTAMGRKTVST